MEFLRLGIFGMTQVEFAVVIGMTQRSVSGYESGRPSDHDKMPLFAFRNARRYAKASGIDWPDDLMNKILDEDTFLIEE